MGEHRFILGDSRSVPEILDNSVDLIVTSPPYPMIEMWDEVFSDQNPEIMKDLKVGKDLSAFTKMHQVLNDVWEDCHRVLKQGAFICINIGDATRSLNGNFMLYPNHVLIMSFFLRKGYTVMPEIIWRKVHNSPIKFMGSGCYPVKAYVTQEHEHILIFRKGKSRVFTESEEEVRRKSAFFWEERNAWFSDLWFVPGALQGVPVDNEDDTDVRRRNASYPLEIPYRLINMHSIEGDLVYDPFSGFGTTAFACMASNRNSVNTELYGPVVMSVLNRNFQGLVSSLNTVIEDRLSRHEDYLRNLSEEDKSSMQVNKHYGFKVKSNQEVDIKINPVYMLSLDGSIINCDYAV